MANHVSATSPHGCFHGAFAGAQLTRYGFVAAGAPPHRRSLQELAVPGGFLVSKGDRPAVVAAAAPGASDKGLPSADSETAVSNFRFEMGVFKMSHRPIALVGNPADPLLDAASSTAQDCMPMVEFLLAKEDVHPDIVKELVPAGQAFLIVEGQANEGYVRADALVNAIQGLKLFGKTFFECLKLPEYSPPLVPFSADDVDKNSFFKELIDLFILFYTTLYWEARKKYGFDTRGAN